MSKRKSVIIMLIIFLAIGFATVSTTLVINGILAIGENKDDFKVIFTKAKLNKESRNEFIDNDTKQTINYETDVLSLVNDTSILDYEVTNTSRNYDADVTINLEVPENDYVFIEYEPKTMFIEAGKTVKGSVTVKLKKPTTEDKTISIKCGFNAFAKKRESLAEEYVEPFSRSGTMMVAKNSNDSKENIWQYGPFTRKIVFENKMNSHETTEDLIFDVSETQDGSVMAYYVPLSEEENDVLFEEYMKLTTGMTEEEYKKYLVEQKGMTVSDAILEVVSLKRNSFFPLSEEDKNNYLEEIIKAEMGMTLEEYKQHAIEQEGMTEEEFNTEIDQIKKNMFDNNFSEYVFYTLYVQSDTGIKANPNSSYLFHSFMTLQKIEGLEHFDTSQVTNMSHMFSWCFSLSNLDLSSFDTSNVTDMSSMFAGKYDDTRNHFVTLNLSGFNTSKVKNMNRMFQSSSISNLDLCSFDTRSVTDMAFMFMDCYYATELDLSNFDTSSVLDMTKMFSECNYLTKLDLRNFNTSNVTSMDGMFKSCRKLVELDLSSFDTKKVEKMSGMFGYCESLTSLDLSNFHTNSLKVIGDYSIFSGIFQGCSKLTYLDISNFDFSLIENTRESFDGMSGSVCVNVKDKEAQDWILALSSSDRPSSWTTDNVIIKTA